MALIHWIFLPTFWVHTGLWNTSKLFGTCDDFLRLSASLKELRKNGKPKDGLHDVVKEGCLNELASLAFEAAELPII